MNDVNGIHSDQRRLDLPDGEYTGRYGGYEVELTTVGWRGLSFHVNRGIRGFGIPVTITVKDGVAYVKESM
jgi:hypothetical protein